MKNNSRISNVLQKLTRINILKYVKNTGTTLLNELLTQHLKAKVLLFVELLQAQKHLWRTSSSPKGRGLLHGCIWSQILPQTWGNKIKLLPKPLGMNSKDSDCQLPQTTNVPSRAARTTEMQVLHLHAGFSRVTTAQQQSKHIFFSFESQQESNKSP